MNISTYDNQYWLELKNNLVAPLEPDGFLFVFFPHLLIRADNSKKGIFIEKIKIFMDINEIRHVSLSQPYHERCVIYTSCDKASITHIMHNVKKDFNIKQNRILWIAMHEQEAYWKEGELLQLINFTFNAYDKKLLKENVKMNRNIASFQSRTFKKFYEEVIMHRDSLVVKPVFKPLNYTEKPNTAFVLMPLTETWSDQTYSLIKKSGIKGGFNVARASDFFEPNIIMDEIWENINQSSLIIADISVHNANVFYELGIAHTLGKKVIMIKQKNDIPAPFDIKAWRYIEYDLMPIEAEQFVSTLTILFQQYSVTK